MHTLFDHPLHTDTMRTNKLCEHTCLCVFTISIIFHLFSIRFFLAFRLVNWARICREGPTKMYKYDCGNCLWIMKHENAFFAIRKIAQTNSIDDPYRVYGDLPKVTKKIMNFSTIGTRTAHACHIRIQIGFLLLFIHKVEMGAFGFWIGVSGSQGDSLFHSLVLSPDLI